MNEKSKVVVLRIQFKIARKEQGVPRNVTCGHMKQESAVFECVVAGKFIEAKKLKVCWCVISGLEQISTKPG